MRVARRLWTTRDPRRTRPATLTAMITPPVPADARRVAGAAGVILSGALCAAAVAFLAGAGGASGWDLLAVVALGAVAPELIRVDLREHRLPNPLNLVAAAGGLAAVLGRLATGEPTTVPLVAALTVGAGLLALSLLGGVGMGDVKLGLAIGLASPTALVAVSAPLAAFLLGGIGAVVALLRHGAGRRIAFGPFLLAGWLLALALQAASRG